MTDEIDVEKIIREYIEYSNHLSLGTSNNNKPWVCEVHFAYDDDLNLYFRSQPHRRHSKEIELNSNVSGNIVRQHKSGEYPHAIYFEGIAHKLSHKPDIDSAFLQFQRCLDSEDSIIEDALLPDGHHFYKIIVKNWYAFGKFGKVKGAKYQLEWNGDAI